MNTLTLNQILKQISGGCAPVNTDDKIENIQNKAEEMQKRVDNAYNDLNLPQNELNLAQIELDRLPDTCSN